MIVDELGDLVEDTKSRLFEEEGVMSVGELSPKSVNLVRSAHKRFIKRRSRLRVYYRTLLDQGFIDQLGHNLVETVPEAPEGDGNAEEEEEQSGQNDDLHVQRQHTVSISHGPC